MSITDQLWSPTSVQVTAVQARGLRVKGKHGTNDAYAVMQVGKEKFQTSVVEKSVAPVWKEEAAFELLPGGRSTLQVHVLHRALVGPDKLLGQAVIDLLQLSEDTGRDKTAWFKLLDKTGKSDKDRGEVLVDIQFMRNNMTASMFDLSAAGKSRSRLGKFKDKVRGKKKESDASSAVVPAFSQVLTDSEEEGKEGVAEAAGRDEEEKKKKKHKMKSLFAPKSNLQKNLSQSMTVLPGKNSSLTGSLSSLNADPSEGKKKFKFLKHKRSDSRDSQKQTEQSNLCINGSHIYCEEPQPRSARTGSTFSLTSSGHGSMEDVPESSPPSVDSLRVVQECPPWTEEQEEAETSVSMMDCVTDNRRLEEEECVGHKRHQEIQSKEEEEQRSDEGRRVGGVGQHKVLKMLKRFEEGKQEKRGGRKINEENQRMDKMRVMESRASEEERIRKEEEMAEKEKIKQIEEDEERLVEERRRQEEEEERSIMEERMQKQEAERAEQRKKEEEQKWKDEQEKLEKKRILEEEEEEEERKRQERIKKEEEEIKKLHEEKQQREEWERRQAEEERVQKEKEELLRRAVEEKRQKEEERKQIEEERIQREQEKLWEEERVREMEEKKRQEEERKLEERRREEERKLEEEKMEQERLMKEQRVRKEEEESLRRAVEEKRQKEEERKLEEKRREEERKLEEKRREEERKRIEEEEIQREQEKLWEEERVRREMEEKKRLEEERKLEENRREEERKLEEKRQEEERKLEEERRIRMEQERLMEEERVRKVEEENLKREMEEKRQAEERKRAEEARIREENDRFMEEERIRKEEEDLRREEEQKVRRAEQERKKLEEEAKKRDEEERIQKEEEQRLREEQEERRRQEEQAKLQEQVRIEREEQERRDEEERVRREQKLDEERRMMERRAEAEQTMKEHQRSKHEERRIQNAELKGQLDEETRERSAFSEEKDDPGSSKNPFEENLSDNPFDEIPDSPNVSTVLPRCQSDSSDGSEAGLTTDKDHAVSQRKKSPAPQPPARNPAVRRRQQERDESQAQMIMRHGDPKTVGAVPQRLAEAVPSLRLDTKTGDDTGPSERVKHSKGPAPSRPSQGLKPLSIGAKSGRSLNPFEEDDAEDTEIPGSAISIVNCDAEAKTKSSKVTRAPKPPANPTAPSTSDPVTDNLDLTPPCDSDKQMCDADQDSGLSVSFLESSPRKSVPQQRVDESRTRTHPPTTPRRLQPVKPLNALEHQDHGQEVKSASVVEQQNKQIKRAEVKGPYSLLTQEELVGLVQKQEQQLLDRDKKIAELELYIDNLLVRVMEEQPSILMSMTSMKRTA